jgi:uncharacterized membrane protein
MVAKNSVDESGSNDDIALDQKIAVLLRVGIYTAALVILCGGIFFLIDNGTSHPDYRTFQRLPENLRSPKAILIAAFHGRPTSIMQLGILLLIATPVARVVLSVVAFAVKRDLLYFAISGIVLVVLLYSLIYH